PLEHSCSRFYECKDKSKCIPLDHACDGHFDCDDASDESNDCYDLCFNHNCTYGCVPSQSGVECACSTTSAADPCGDVDVSGQRVFWTDSVEKKVYAYRLGLVNPRGLAYEWNSQQLYIVDASLGAVVACTHNGSACSVVVKGLGSRQPEDIVVDPESRQMFWTELSHPARVMSSDLDGKNSMPIITDLGQPGKMVIDQETGRLYVVDMLHKSVRYVDLNNRTSVQFVLGVVSPSALTIVQSALVWFEKETGDMKSANKLNGEDQLTLMEQSNSIQVTGAAALYRTVQPPGDSPCKNALCTQQCLPSNSDSSYACACPPDMILSSDKNSCTWSHDSRFLFVATSSEILQIPVNNIGTLTYRPLSSSTMKNVGTLDYNPVTKDIFYSSVNSNGHPAIFRLTDVYQRQFRVQTIEDHAEYLSEAQSLIVDWVADNVLWLNSYEEMIEVFKVDGSARSSIFLEYADNPVSIAANFTAGYLYISCWGDDPRIEKCHMDGSHCHIFVDEVHQPHHLTLHRGRLYWNDLDLAEFSSVDAADGTDMSNGGCSHICLSMPENQRQCMCPANMELGDDEQTCEVSSHPCPEDYVFCESSQRCILPTSLCSGKETCRSLVIADVCRVPKNRDTAYLLVAANSFLKQVSMDGENEENLVSKAGDVAIDVECRTGDIVWSQQDSAPGSGVPIQHYQHDVTTTLQTVNSSVHSLCVDWVTGNIYYTASTQPPLEAVSRLVVCGGGGHFCKTLKRDDTWWMFWINIAKSTIERAFMDGSGTKSIVSEVMGRRACLTIDHVTERLFWIQGSVSVEQVDSIETAKLDGTDRYTLASYRSRFFTSIATFEGFLYLTETLLNSIVKVSSFSGRPVLGTVRAMAGTPTRLRIVHPLTQPDVSNPCAEKACKYLCVLAESGASCLCPDDVPIADWNAASNKVKPAGPINRLSELALQETTTQMGVRTNNRRPPPIISYDNFIPVLPTFTTPSHLKYHTATAVPTPSTTQKPFRMIHLTRRPFEKLWNTASPPCNRFCVNGGICSIRNGTPVCKCPAGYHGSRCDIPPGIVPKLAGTTNPPDEIILIDLRNDSLMATDLISRITYRNPNFKQNAEEGVVLVSDPTLYRCAFTEDDDEQCIHKKGRCWKSSSSSGSSTDSAISSRTNSPTVIYRPVSPTPNGH
ncbi:hypothetical protein BaRGS_00004258, partial [Batillaria attramentaria]